MIPVVDLTRQHAALRSELAAAMGRVLDSARFVLGDEMQATILRVKLGRLGKWTEARRRIAARYTQQLGGLGLELPTERGPARHVYHLYTVRHPQRDNLAKILAERGVGTAVHYPTPVPAQPMFGPRDERQWPEAARAAREVLSLPCVAELRDEEIATVIEAVREGCEKI
ncbi:MAG: DegT/DnrJ/EryC1/StrS family aminotransferase [Candidatus Rokubacteria bacterium]|nr:DegT/DnrJ/EryC1/StrS family aminotransferase [Candidatus Rokubacteria bacterium]